MQEIELSPIEDQKPYKTIHLILKSPRSSFSQSVYSVPFRRKIIPNRDYPYEGLSTIHRGENWHILDGVAFGCAMGLLPKRVIASHESFRYRYSSEGEWLEVLYRLGTRGELVIDYLSSVDEIVAEPIFDIRHMYDPSKPAGHRVNPVDRGFVVEKDGVKVFFLSQALRRFVDEKSQTGWYYKLGTGELSDHGFIGEQSELFIPGVIELEPRGRIVISYDGVFRASVQGLTDAASSRERSMRSFGMEWENVMHREAGDFWFRTIWLRDEFEGLLWNIKTLMRLGKREEIRNIIFHAFTHLKGGKLPNRLLEREGGLDYNAADTLLLGFLLTEKYLDLTGWQDRELMKLLLGCAERAISSYMRADPDLIDGGPLLHSSGLLSVVPYHSWIDSIVDGYPSRLPEAWRGVCEFKKPQFFLPEINALWIRMLAFCMKMTAALDIENGKFADLFERAVASYRNLLICEGFPVYVRGIEGSIDGRLSSPALVSVSLLKAILFSKVDVKGFLDEVEQRLLVRRRGDAFGIVVLEGYRGYRGEKDYHRGVIWPRDTPYLIDLLRWVGDSETVGEILRSNLSHQMDEGFLFYAAELFSPEEDEIIPVKNPIQFWSGWVDPYEEAIRL
jgi:hypothetical protein